MKKKNKFNCFVYIVFGIFVVAIFFSNQSSFITLFLLLLSIWWGLICKNMALNHNKNQIIGFLTGFLFSIIGLIGYWIYIHISKKSEKKMSKDKKLNFTNLGYLIYKKMANSKFKQKSFCKNCGKILSLKNQGVYSQRRIFCNKCKKKNVAWKKQ